MKTILAALACGIVFGLGLSISEMINPARVIGFLDVAGEWDLTLMLVMGGALVLIQPVSIDPRLVGEPVALLVGILARLQWACYKKHL